MSSSNKETFLRNLVNEKKFLSKPAKKKALKRGEDIPQILDKLSEYEYELREDGDLPRIEYRGAVERYLVGFYEDSIRNSLISVEIGLIIKLNEILPENKKQEIYRDINREKEPISFTFGSIVNLASNRKYRILKGKKIKNTIESLIKQRNIHFHTSTFLSGLIYQQKIVIIPLLEDYLNNLNMISRNKYMNIIPAVKKMNDMFIEKKGVLENLSDYSWCTPKNNVEIVKEEVNSHMNKLKKQSEMTIEEVKKNFIKILTLRQKMKDIIEDKYMKNHALKILLDSFEVLTHINIF